MKNWRMSQKCFTHVTLMILMLFVAVTGLRMESAMAGPGATAPTDPDQRPKLAPVLNTATLPERVTVQAGVRIATMVKRHGDAYYVFEHEHEPRSRSGF